MNENIPSKIYIGDSREILKKIPKNSIQVILTSPPYWGTRDYDVNNQIGLENTLDEYINNLLIVFDEVYRILNKNGVFWLNVGDCYTSGNRKYRSADKKNKNRAIYFRPDTPKGLKPKDLIGIPWRIALTLQKRGWYLRSNVIWAKPNPMPESVTDRPTTSHEHLFLFSKSKKYFFNKNELKHFNNTVWLIPNNNKKKRHIATFPEELIKPCILSSSKENDVILDPFFGSGTVGLVSEMYNRRFIGIELNKKYVYENNNLLLNKAEIIE